MHSSYSTHVRCGRLDRRMWTVLYAGPLYGMVVPRERGCRHSRKAYCIPMFLWIAVPDVVRGYEETCLLLLNV